MFGPWRGPALAVLRDAVECWIDVTENEGRRVVKLAGRFGEAQVPEFLQSCAGSGELTLDLTYLVSADAAGLDALRRTRLRGAAVVGASGYIQLKLDARGVPPDHDPNV